MPSYRVPPFVLFQFVIWALLAATGPAQSRSWDRSPEANWQHDLVAWRTQHAVELQKPDGWLALVGLEWLQPGDNGIGFGPDNEIHLLSSTGAQLCVQKVVGKTVTLNPPSSGFPDDFLIDGKTAAPQNRFTGTDNDDKNPRLTFYSLVMYVIQRGDRFALRIKDTKSKALTDFHGLKWFPANAKYRVQARSLDSL
jgi:uncharacterized protein (DUF1684 family)